MNDSSFEIRRAPWWLFVFLFATLILMNVLGEQWFGPSGVWDPVDQLSHGLLNETLICNVAIFLVVICGALLGVGRREPREVGLEGRKLPAAAVYTCILWIVLQVVLGGCYVGFGRSLAVANGWDDIGILQKAGGLVGQFLGNALCEEIIFRGFLLTQCVLLFRALWPHRPRTAFLVSFCLAALIFTVWHLPYDLRADRYTSLSQLAWNQADHFFWGCAFGWIYWKTRNLFFVVGVHAVQNEPTTLFVWHNLGPLTTTTPVVFLVGVGIAAAWHRLPVRTRDRPVHNSGG